MATITVSVAAPQGTLNVRKSLSDADLARLIAALGVSLDHLFLPVTNPDGTVTPARPKTNANLIKAWVNEWLAQTKKEVRYIEENEVSAEDALRNGDFPITDA